MSEEMAVSDNTTGDEATVNNDTEAGAAEAVEQVAGEVSNEDAAPQVEDPAPAAEVEQPETKPEPIEHISELKEEPISDHELGPPEDIDSKSDIDIKEEFVPPLQLGEGKGIKRRASTAFSDIVSDDFKGFADIKDEISASDYYQILERLEAEVTAASKGLVRLRTVMGIPALRASKRHRKDTDGSRPSSALSSRSEDGGTDASTASSPANRRRNTTEMSSPLLRVPLERGWKRELVYRAALDSYSRRNADIYYYSPQGKKLRSTREVSEHLAGTGLTLENFSFFKEPLGVDDPDKEIIRDAKLMSRKAESPAAAPPPLEGKRTPKPRQPKGVSPEPPPPAIKSPPLKLKVKSVGSRLSNSTATPTTTPTTKQKKAPPTTPSTDNNNSASWKKPSRGGARREEARPPPPADRTDAEPPPQSQPCSLTCGRGVPSLSCAVCLCLYHAPCAGYTAAPPPDPFYCKNCRKSSSPPPALKAAPPPRRVAVPPAAPADKRVMLRMKVSGGSADGSRVWAVSPCGAAAAPARPPRVAAPPPRVAAPPPRVAAPQSLVLLNGRRFVVVPRSVVQPQQPEEKRGLRGRVANGAASPPTAVMSPRRRPRRDDTDHFTAFYNKAQELNYNVVVQIFQYLGMRDLAHSARVCKLWKQMATTPALWRHVRMKNSHVSDWSGLCSALKRHGTKRLDLRKMLLPQNDAIFWEQFAEHIAKVDTLERIEMCRCPARAVEAVCLAVPGLTALSALAIRDAQLDPAPLAALPQLSELRLKSMAGLSLTHDLSHLAALTKLQHLSLTSIKELGWCACDVIGSLVSLESLELGECTFGAEFAAVLSRLRRLRRLRLERGTPHCAAPHILRALAALPLLTRLELVNIDVKVGFDDALAACTNVRRLLIIPTYVSQSATTNRQVLSGVLRLKHSLTHLMWGVTIELLRVTELFVDQCERAGEARRRDAGECIPVLKPVPGARGPEEPPATRGGPPQVEILPLPTLQRLLAQQLPHTRLKLLRIPFHATWRQSLADFQ